MTAQSLRELQAALQRSWGCPGLPGGPLCRAQRSECFYSVVCVCVPLVQGMHTQELCLCISTLWTHIYRAPTWCLACSKH